MYTFGLEVATRIKKLLNLILSYIMDKVGLTTTILRPFMLHGFKLASCHNSSDSSL